MAWDIQLEAESGDLVFSPARDIAGVSGEQILRQRISIRCKIPKGTYMYDVDGSLGSNLHLVPRNSPVQQMQNAQAAVMDALAPMTDEIDIENVEVTQTEDNTLQINVVFRPILTDPDVPTIANELADTETTSVVIAAE